MSNINFGFVHCNLTTSRFPESESYKKQFEYHLQALEYPNAWEKCILDMLYTLADYADTHQRKYGSTISEDGVMGEYWLEMLRNLNNLLDGDTGRLDCGTVHHAIQELAKNVGFKKFEA